MPSGFPSAIRAGDAGPPGTRAPQRLVQQRPSAVTHARVWAVALSLAATRAISVDFSSSGYLDVSVPRVASSQPIRFSCGWRGTTPAGFPHSGTWGSRAVCASPQTIAACRALRRLPAPRHPPRAHTSFAFRLIHGFPKCTSVMVRISHGASRSQMRTWLGGLAPPCKIRI